MNRSEKLILCVAAIAAGSFADVEAAQRADCEATYVTRPGDSFANIAARAYAAPMAMLIAARNENDTAVTQPLPTGTELLLPCLHGLPQYSPHMEYLQEASQAAMPDPALTD